MSLTTENQRYLDRADALLKERLDARRYWHSVGVSETAAILAYVYGVDEFSARLAGLLHDWDKRLSPQKLLELANSYEISLGDDPNKILPILHGKTAAYSLLEVFPELSKAVRSAIAKHTTAARKMSDLDKVVFVADTLEPGRGDDEALVEMRDLIGRVSLNELYFRTLQQKLFYLMQGRRHIFPKTIKIYNDLVDAQQHSRDLAKHEALMNPKRALHTDSCKKRSGKAKKRSKSSSRL